MKKVGLFLDANPYGGGTFQYNQAVLEAAGHLPRERFEVVIVYTHPIWLDYLKSYSLNSIKVPRRLIGRSIGRLWWLSGLPVSWWRKISRYIHPIAKTLVAQNCNLWIFPSQDSWSYQVKVPALAAIHDLMHRYERHFPEVSANGEFERREKHYFNMCRWVKGVLVDSEVGRQQVHESYGMPVDRIFVLPFIPPRYIYENNISSNELERKYHLPRKFIFYPAQFWKHKNHNRLVKAIAAVKEEIPDIQLVLVGSPKNGYQRTRQLVEQLGLQNNVHFIGYVPDKYMPAFYCRARAMVMPTFFGPTNIPQLEAFATGCPTATSRIYGIPEQVGDAALLFNPYSVEEIAHCINRLWKDDALCAGLVKKGKERAAKWGQRQFNRRLLNIIDQMT